MYLAWCQLMGNMDISSAGTAMNPGNNNPLLAYQNKVALQRQQEIGGLDLQLNSLSPRNQQSLSPRSPHGCSPLGSPNKSHKCQHCYKAFPSTQQLGQHSLVHSNVRKYACNYCDKTFKQLSHLQQHHRRHTGERPYRCPFVGCEKAFAQLSNLQQHQRNHENKLAAEEQRPFFCRICDRRFTTDNGLTKHIAKVHGEGRDMRRGPLPPNTLSNPSELLATLARNAIANTVTTLGTGQSATSNNVAALSSREHDNLPMQLTSVTVSASPQQQGPPKDVVVAKCDPLQAQLAIKSPVENTDNNLLKKAHEDEGLKIVRKNLEALSKKDLNLLKSSRSRLYDFPSQVPAVMSSAYSSPQ